MEYSSSPLQNTPFTKSFVLAECASPPLLINGGAGGLCLPATPTGTKKAVLYKTELCRSFEETGFCRYGTKCQFAHEYNELRTISRHPRYKTEVCKTFWELGQCPYGKRCCFIHCEKGAAKNTGSTEMASEPGQFAPLLSASISADGDKQFAVASGDSCCLSFFEYTSPLPVFANSPTTPCTTTSSAAENPAGSLLFGEEFCLVEKLKKSPECHQPPSSGCSIGGEFCMRKKSTSLPEAFMLALPALWEEESKRTAHPPSVDIDLLDCSFTSHPTTSGGGTGGECDIAEQSLLPSNLIL